VIEAAICDLDARSSSALDSRPAACCDNPESEIEVGNRLGMRTVQILRPDVTPGTAAAHYIHGLDELRRLLETGREPAAGPD
jgi:hypothetical protein